MPKSQAKTAEKGGESANVPGHVVPAAMLADAIGKERVEAYIAALDWLRQRRNDATVAAIDRFMRDPWCDPDLRHAGAVRLTSLREQFALAGVMPATSAIESVRDLCARIQAVYSGCGMRIEGELVYWPDQRPLLPLEVHVAMWRRTLRSRPSAKTEMAIISLAAEKGVGREESAEQEIERLRGAIRAAEERIGELEAR